MIAYLRELERRRLVLVERSAAQRAALAEAAAPITRRLALADRVVATMRAHPLLTGLAAGAIVFLGKQRLFAWAVRAVGLYSLLRLG